MLISSPLVDLHGGCWIDPCAGTGRIPSVVNSLRDDVVWTMFEIDPRHAPTLATITRGDDVAMIRDFLGVPVGVSGDVLIMNPPFSLALDFVRHGMAMAETVVMLQRLNWLGPARADWLRENHPDVYVLPKRPSFTDDGKTDATEYAWFVWRDGLGNRAGEIAMLDAAPRQVALFGGVQ